jgi:hypothetical protein
MRPVKTQSAQLAGDRADMLAAPTILVAMLLLVISVLRPQMMDAPTAFVVLALVACGLLFVTMMAMFFEKERLGIERTLLAGVAALLLGLGIAYSATLHSTLIATACGIPATACIFAWAILRNAHRVDETSQQR